MRQKIILIIFLLLFVSSCTYHLRYTITSEGRPLSSKAFFEKTYAVEKKDDSLKEYELLKTLTQSLELNGWNKVPNDEAQYIFTVSFETEKREEIDEFWLMRVFGGSGRFLYRTTSPRRHTYSYHYLEIEVSSSNRLHTWSSKIKTGPVLQEIETVANHIIPKAIALFPEEGNWEIEDDVYLHTEE
jgi:hypothetical protein